MAIQKVLVVDDSATDRFYLTEMLEDAGYDVETLESGEACVEQAGSVAPDLIVMDIIMTGLTGFQAARALNKNPETVDIPIVLTSGKLQVTDLAWAEKMGAFGCLQKPIDKAELMAMLEKLSA